MLRFPWGTNVLYDVDRSARIVTGITVKEMKRCPDIHSETKGSHQVL
jgi:hypothetical protein